MTIDVAIIGGGLAGNCLARHLRLHVPDLSVVVFERRAEPSYKVGESSVEIASCYWTKRLGLTGYMFDHQLPKNGLRFFCDSEQRDAELHQMSEIGSNRLPYHLSFQLDRAAMERDLRAMNEAMGVRFEAPARVRDVRLSSDSGPHRFVVEGEGHSGDHTARWLIDASGRGRVLQKSVGMTKVDVDHPLSAVWGRYRNVVDIDRLGPASWHDSVGRTSRRLSTNHFCYPGYWIWFIPLRGDVTSVGVVGVSDIVTPKVWSPEGFARFLHEHGAPSRLMEGAELVDLMSYKQLAYGTERFFGDNRWGMTGESAAFSDPFYSPGSDFIAMENDFLVDLIRRDITGEPPSAIAERARTYDSFMQFRFEATMLLYRDQYRLLGCWPLLELKTIFDIGAYYLFWFHPYLHDRHLDVEFLRDQLRQRDFILNAMRNFSELFRKIEVRRRERNTYYRDNLGRLCTERPYLEAEVGGVIGHKDLLRRAGTFFNDCRDRALALLDDRPPDPDRKPLPLFEFLLERPLA